MKAYTVITCADQDGRSVKVLGIFANYTDAKAVFKAGLCYGFTKPEQAISEIEVHESLVAFVVHKPRMPERTVRRLLGPGFAVPELRRARALAKLSPEDRAALGLTA